MRTTSQSNNTCRDRFWLWGQDFSSYQQAGDNFWKLPGLSRMTPAEGAFYLGIPNVMIVRFGNRPEPRDFRQYALPLTPLARVVWSVVGDGSSTDNNGEPDIEPVLRLAAEFPNVTGAIMDDTWDFGDSAPLPMAAMEHQCRLGLEWLKAGRVAGLVFLSNYIADLGLETVAYARDFIARHGDEERA